MNNQLKAIAVGLLCSALSGCAAVSAIAEIGNEHRQDDTDRQVAVIGTELALKNGVSASVKYVNKVVDADFAGKDEHGAFVSLKVPIWRAH